MIYGVLAVAPAWLLWLGAAVALLLADLALLGAQAILLGTAAAAGITAIAAAFGIGLTAQAWTFVGTTAVLTPLGLWGFRRFFDCPEPGPREQGWAIGQNARIDERHGRRVAVIGGTDYPFRTEDGSNPPPGARIRITRMEGVTLVGQVADDSHHQQEGNSP